MRALLREVCARYGGIPDAILREPELLQLLLPALRADLEALETYVLRARALPSAVRSRPSAAWTTAGRPPPSSRLGGPRRPPPSRCVSFAGGHFYLQSAESLVCEEILSRLAAHRRARLGLGAIEHGRKRLADRERAIAR